MMALKRTENHLVAAVVECWISFNLRVLEFGARRFRSIQGFNGDDLGSDVGPLGKCTKTFWRSSTTLPSSHRGTTTSTRRWLTQAVGVVIRGLRTSM
jgi:hypothetical protein